jgi:hypothetical protein
MSAWHRIYPAFTAPSCPAVPADMPAASRELYRDKLDGFWQSLDFGNGTGLVTEIDKIGGDGRAGCFYTRADWGQPDHPSFWGEGLPSKLSPTTTRSCAGRMNAGGQMMIATSSKYCCS